MQIIYKYKYQENISVPVGAEFLTADMQHSHIILWFSVNPTASTTQRKFKVVGTGQYYDAVGLSYLTTIFDGQFVWHLFERISL